MENGKIKIAFIKFGGLASGGTEKFLQIIAANLPRDRFDVDYYYCDAAPYVGSDYKHVDTDKSRLEYMHDHGVNLIKFKVGFKDITKKHHDWLETDFWSLFNENNYDLIQVGKAGMSEYPVHLIKKTPIIDIVCYPGGVDNQFNISRVIHLVKWSSDQWIKNGGDASRVRYIYLPVDMSSNTNDDFRSELKLENKFIYGMHQRDADGIFSEIPLAAFKLIESENNAFLIMGGSQSYRKQVSELGLKNVHFLDFSGDMNRVHKFLRTLDVYAHGRKDGEINSQSIAEAMYFGLPIVSHLSEIANGHVECIANAGKVLKNHVQYAAELKNLCDYRDYYDQKSQASTKRFQDKYELSGQIANIVSIYEDALMNPFPNPWCRRISKYRISYRCRKVFKIIWSSLYQKRDGVLKPLKSILWRLRNIIYSQLYRDINNINISFQRHDQHFSQPLISEYEKIAGGVNEQIKLYSSPYLRLQELTLKYPNIKTSVDIGSGSGWLSAKLIREGFRRIYAIEPSKSGLEISKKLFSDPIYQGIYWINGFAQDELRKLIYNEPMLFVTGYVLSHLPDRVVEEICSSINNKPKIGSVLSFSESYGLRWYDEFHDPENLNHIRTINWWRRQLPNWELSFDGAKNENVPGCFIGIRGVKIK